MALMARFATPPVRALAAVRRPAEVSTGPEETTLGLASHCQLRVPVCGKLNGALMTAAYLDALDLPRGAWTEGVGQSDERRGLHRDGCRKFDTRCSSHDSLHCVHGRAVLHH